jgi:metallopeptidase MepB
MINWNINKKDIIDDTMEMIKKSKNNIDNLIKNPLKNKNDVLNFLDVLSSDINEFSNFHSVYAFLQFINIDLREASQKSDEALVEYCNIQNANVDFYNKIILFYKNAKKYNILDEQDVKLISRLIKNYGINGIEKNKNILTINQEIKKLENNIATFVGDSENKTMQLSIENLGGLPDQFINNLPIIVKSPLRYGIKLTKTNFELCMKYIDDHNIRKKIENEYSNKFLPIINDIIKLLVLRNKKANILGFKSYADFKTSSQMTKRSDNVKEFLNDLLQKLDYRYYKEFETLLRLKKNDLPDEANIINSWDLLYYLNKWKNSYGIDEYYIQEFFEINNTLKRIMDIYQEIFSVQFKFINTTVWDPSVKTFEIYSSDNKIIGYLHIDLLSRNNKVRGIRTYCLRQACSGVIPVIALIGSFDPLHNKKTENVLLHYQEVISLFHEFGHVFHNIFGTTKYTVFSGTNVEIDFVEVPAFTLDLLCWNNENILKRLSCHYKTKLPLPESIIKKIIKIKNLDIGIYYKKHILLSQYDQLIHSNDKLIKLYENIVKAEFNIDIDPKKIFVEFYKKLSDSIMTYEGSYDKKYKINLNNGIIFPVEIIDIVCSCDGIYYSHVWSKVLSCELYYFDKNIFNIGGGENLKNKILIYGGLKNAYDLIKNYINKKPSIDGFIKMYCLEDNDEEFSFYGENNTFPVSYAKKNIENNFNNNKFSEINESEIDNY